MITTEKSKVNEGFEPSLTLLFSIQPPDAPYTSDKSTPLG